MKLGGHHNKETKEKIKMNNVRYWLGKKRPQMMGNTYSKGKPSWNKGKKLTEEHKKHLRKPHKGIPWNKGLKGFMVGELNNRWKGGITPLRKQIRSCFKYRQWRSDIFTKDDFACQKCGIRGGKLNAHHIKSFSDIIQEYQIKTIEQALDCEELWNINNGRTLCGECHKKTKNYLKRT